MMKARPTKIFGWVVEIGRAAPGTPLQVYVAEPEQLRAIELVRLQRPEAAGGRLEAKTPLSAHTVYALLRMKRGQVTMKIE